MHICSTSMHRQRLSEFAPPSMTQVNNRLHGALEFCATLTISPEMTGRTESANSVTSVCASNSTHTTVLYGSTTTSFRSRRTDDPEQMRTHLARAKCTQRRSAGAARTAGAMYSTLGSDAKRSVQPSTRAHSQPATHSWSLLECAALRRSSVWAPRFSWAYRQPARLVPPTVCGSWPLLAVWDSPFSWAHRQPVTHT